ncbi:hypothetical protein BDV40DRAFT_115805 [Aspergillus tamarii]|uniref:Uncharacterized protein n=1 Tax=Aspergillus tamarii TaxID=41984 RepID=A0A5N6UAE1_ASPTM|nr:hypothetical protein BDV40DRAFT_115805 [Aspergillus tamarii]
MLLDTKLALATPNALYFLATIAVTSNIVILCQFTLHAPVSRRREPLINQFVPAI